MTFGERKLLNGVYSIHGVSKNAVVELCEVAIARSESIRGSL